MISEHNAPNHPCPCTPPFPKRNQADTDVRIVTTTSKQQLKRRLSLCLSLAACQLFDLPMPHLGLCSVVLSCDPNPQRAHTHTPNRPKAEMRRFSSSSLRGRYGPLRPPLFLRVRVHSLFRREHKEQGFFPSHARFSRLQ